MRPALQRLLSRPSSLNLLGYLVESSYPSYIKSRPASLGRRRCPRHVTTRASHTDTTESVGYTKKKPRTHENLDEDSNAAPTIAYTEMTVEEFQTRPLIPPTKNLWGYDHRLQSSKQMEYQSDVGRTYQFYGSRLVDRPIYRGDHALWLHLLEFRRRRFGSQGVKDIWFGMMLRNVDIPVEGNYADALWDTFLGVGFEDIEFLQEKLIPYADSLQVTEGKRWSPLYLKIMVHFFDNGSYKQIETFHSLLKKHHSPSAKQFAGLFCGVIKSKGKMKAFKMVYQQQKHRNMYSVAIDELCKQKEFRLAFDMHQFLTHKGDFPKSSAVVLPLINYFTTHDPEIATQIKNRLVSGGVSIEALEPPKPKSRVELSRQMMNFIQGETYNIKEKKYDDSLGARWFATSWINLDTAILAVHTLGVETIGPLSLQAMALRDRTTQAVYSRIQQLDELGISIGDSRFSKAVRSFSKNNNQQFLDDLLRSDQHPDSLEDWKLQEKLLASYQESEDWRNYNRTMAILTLGLQFQDPKEANIYLRTLVTRGKVPNLLQALDEMRLQKVQIDERTVKYILDHLLSRRLPGKRPEQMDDLDTVVLILMRLLQTDNPVPKNSFDELMRRLGMMGRLKDLEKLILSLLQYYSPTGFNQYISGPLDKPIFKPSTPHPGYHPEHPFRTIFDARLQKSIVEWSFLNAWKPRINLNSVYQTGMKLHPVRWGIGLLHTMQNYGVYVEGPAVRNAIVDRLVQLYGPGTSLRIRNRKIMEANDLSLSEMKDQLEDAWGGNLWASYEDLELLIKKKSGQAIRKQGLVYQRRPQHFQRSGLTPNDVIKQNQFDAEKSSLRDPATKHRPPKREVEKDRARKQL